MSDREELAALRRLAELEAKAGGAAPSAPATPQPKNWRDTLADVVELARPGAIGQKINQGIEHAAYNTGAAVNDAAAKVMPAPYAAALGTAANVGVQSIPMLIGGEWGASVQPSFERGGEKMMQKALRPTLKALETGKAQRAATTLLEEGINPTSGGLEVLQADITKNKALADALVSGATGSLNKYKVANRAVIPLLSEVEKSPLPMADISAVQSAGNEFLNHPLLQSGRSIPVQLAQEMKEAAYRKMGDSAYGAGLKPAAERDAVKALARELRIGIEGVVPEVGPLNARTSDLINAKKIAERRVLIGGNNNLLPLGASVATAVNNPGAALGLWANSSDLVKSLAARLLYSGQIPANTGRVAGAMYGAQLANPPTE